jgi:hypothetical protein
MQHGAPAMIDRDTFFNGVRASLFGGKLSQSQVDGMNYLLDVWEDYFEKPNPRDGNRWLSYCMATVFHETGKKMVPVPEVGKGKGYAYGKPSGPYNQIYYGRGHVQLTWEDNYKKGQDQLKDNYGVDVPIWPQADLMLKDQASALILYDGMTNGWFTGVGLSKYFNSTVEDPVNARRVVNGTDKALTIAGYYQKFKAAIVTAPEPAPSPEPQPPETPVITISSNAPVRLKLGDNIMVI